MKLLGKHKQSFELIRTLAITCHALDMTAETLFIFGTYNNKSKKTKKVYDHLLSSNLLHLAVAIRTNIYQGLDASNTNLLISHCGFLDVATNGEVKSLSFSIKDVCDKIIHTDEIYREVKESTEEAKSATIIRGSFKKDKWEHSLSIELFCEAVLNWIDEVEDKKRVRSFNITNK